ncbi:Uncharacterised protein [Streptococcus pneumoniae]|nr:Uncharacterised protein [Streptococcus pneumoniae]
MSQRHTYSPKVRYIKASRGVTFFFENVTQRHTFFKKISIIKGLSKKERHTYSCLVIEC